MIKIIIVTSEFYKITSFIIALFSFKTKAIPDSPR